MENSLIIMIRIKELLENLNEQERNCDYNNILEIVNNYINKNCLHKIVIDSIDIDPERSETIYYCEKCEKTFESLS